MKKHALARCRRVLKKGQKKMKKLLALALACVMSITALAGCQQNQPGANGSISGAADLVGKNIGVQKGTTGEKYVQEQVKDTEPKSFSSGIDAAMALKNGTLDAVVLDELPAKEIVRQNDDLKILDEPLTVEQYAIAVKKGNTDLLNSINATLKRIKEDGTYQSFKDAYMPDDGEIKIPTLDPGTSDKTLKMGTNATFPPFEYMDGNDMVGFDIAVSNEIAKDFGCKLKVDNMEFDSLIAALSVGNVDFVAAGMSVDPERLNEVDFSDPYYDAAQVIIVKK